MTDDFMQTGICIWDGCNKKQRARFLCKQHYSVARKNGIINEFPGMRNAKKLERFCEHPGCDRPHKAKGLCDLHDGRKRNNRLLDAPIKINDYKNQKCIVRDCADIAQSNKMCRFHDQRNKNNVELERIKKGTQLPEILTIEMILNLRWTMEQGYFSSKVGGKRILQHRAIWEAYNGRKLQPFENIHHKNGIRNDNRIENLELWTKTQPSGQRPEDLVNWVLDHYRELVKARLALL